MTVFPGSPKLMKGALVGIEKSIPEASVIIFQYNPTKMTRTLGTKTAGEGAASEVTRVAGAPEETIQMDIEIDATDQLEKAEVNAVSMGIYPQLSAMEMLLYPKTTDVITNTVLMATGAMEIIPPEAPLVLFIWGPKRVVPVKLTRFTINEESYDTRLNPITAKVTLEMRVLNYNDFLLTHPGYSAFIAHQVAKETMAKIGSVGSIGSLGVNIGL